MNIAEILKDKPKGTKLYSIPWGKCTLEEVDTSLPLLPITVRNCLSGLQKRYTKKGTYLPSLDECLLFPSKEMRDWYKFAWKKGDVLVSGDKNLHIIFEGFNDDTYKSFKGKHYLWKEGDEEDYSKEEANMVTFLFEKANDESAQAYIKVIEKRLGGKLNLTSLEIEKAHPEFKYGDIAFADYGNRQDVFIVSGKTAILEGYNSFISLDLRSLTLSMGYRTSFFKKNLCKLRLATKEEKQKLFDALAKKGKACDAEKKMIVDLKPKWTPKPFDRVITRTPDTPWTANFFSHIDSDGIKNCIDDKYIMCLPYNEETAKLIGTTKSLKDIR